MHQAFAEMFSTIAQLSGLSMFGLAGQQIYKHYKKDEEKHQSEIKLSKVMENAKMYEKDSEGNMHYPRIRDIKEQDYGYDMIYTIPYGQDISEWKKQKGKIETALEKEVEFDVKGRKLTMKVLDTELKDEYTYNTDILDDITGLLEVPIGYTKKEFLTLDIADKQMHILISGYPGSGKSVTIRQLLTSTILKYPLNYVHLHLIDLKRVELTLFKKSPYTQSYSATHEEAIENIIKIENEMQYRYNVMEQEPNVSNISQLSGNLPYILVVIDEYAELSPNALSGEEKKMGKQIQSKLGTLFRMGRAAGIFFIICTQRPDSKIIDGQIKANTQVKIAHRVSDKTNSRIILDNNAAAELDDVPGRGIFNIKKNIEFQAPFLSKKKARNLIKERCKQINPEDDNDKVVNLDEHREKKGVIL